jgi:hypothetical protein
MATDIDMCSNALLLIGEEAISSFTQAGHGATVAANLYSDTYKSLLAEHPWTFALKEVFLSRLTQTPDDETGYQYAFQIPTDSIRIWSLMPNHNYAIVGTLIYSNQSEILCRYIYEIAESLLPAHMVKAIEYKLASEFSVAITEDFNKASYYEQKYMMAISKAKSIDSQNYPNVAIQHQPLVDVR